MTRHLTAAAGLVAAGLAAMPAAAQDPADRDDMHRKTQELGFSVGNTYACAEAEEARGEIRSEANLIFDVILKDVGSDMAFAFATAAGYGASLPRAELDCAALAANYEQVRIDFHLVAAPEAGE